MIEICCGSYMDALNAYHGGAKQIELNSALHLGGLTPTTSCLKMVLENTDLKVYCMVRNRGAGFCYQAAEYQQLFQEAKDLLETGAHGIVFGFLNEDHTINLEKTKAMIDLIKSYQREVIFHRAFDCVENPYHAIELLIELGVDRILTSGLKNKAIEGVELLKELQEKYGHQIEILQGSGVNASNVKALIEQTKIPNIHTSCKDWACDPTTIGKDVHYSYGPNGHESDFDIVSVELVKMVIQAYD